MSLAAPSAPGFAEVAVPIPLHQTLTYAVPPEMAPALTRGMRVRVAVGKRRLLGLVTSLHSNPPEGVRVRALEELLDATRVVDDDLLALGEFAADYYLAPIGEVLRAVVPAEVAGWGRQKIRLTDRGGLAAADDSAWTTVRELLLLGGPMSLSQLELALRERGHDPHPIRGRIRDWNQRKWLSIENSAGAPTRRRRGVELPQGELESQLEACGRSAPARAVVELLSSLERPASVEEVTTTVGCSASVLRRLVKLGVLRTFEELRDVSLDRHLLRGERASPITLRDDQRSAVDSLLEALKRASFRTFWLGGMTGAGKTEVYLRAADDVLEKGGSAILLVPEIALVPALARSLRSRYGSLVAILHSNLTKRERSQEWERIRSGAARVVLGPRSAVFAPVRNLRLVVVDEEQDAAYKQDGSPRYNGRDLAVVRAHRSNAVAALVSATPSLETRRNVEEERFGHLELTRRAGAAELPEGEIVDLRKEGLVRKPGEVHFSQRLQAEIERTLGEDNQVILLRNRRGYAPVLLCRACGADHRCDDCGLPKTFHRRERSLICHYCGSRGVAPRRCGECDAEALEAIGAGTERVEERFKELFPDVAVDVLDRDAVRRAGGVASVLERFRQGKTRVLVGTQMVSKGHHFPRVALTGILSADTYLGFPDFRAVERTYSLLTQVAGRSGRGEVPGRFLIQTYHPDHYAIQAAVQHDDATFAREEMRFRRVFHYPPYTRMIQLLSRDRNRDRAQERLMQLARELEGPALARGYRLSGPAPAPLERLKGQWRFQLLIRGASSNGVREVTRQALERLSASDKAARAQEIVVDVDPQALL